MFVQLEIFTGKLLFLFPEPEEGLSLALFNKQQSDGIYKALLASSTSELLGCESLTRFSRSDLSATCRSSRNGPCNSLTKLEK